MRRSLLANLLVVVMFMACGGSRAREAEATHVTGKSIEDVLAAHNDSLMALPGVVGTAIGRCEGTPCIRVFMRDSAAARTTQVAGRLEGYPVRVEVSGMFHAR